MSSVVTDVVTGAIFGSALTAAGVYQPSVILSQMQLRNFHMLQVFLGASAISAAIIHIASRVEYCPVQYRKPSPLGRFNPYMGNIMGGLAIGIGMAITGACPGTAVVQSALAIPTGIYVTCGGILGGILFVKLAPILKQVLPTDSSPSTQGSNRAVSRSGELAADQQHTVHEKYNYHINTVLLTYEVLCLSMIGLAAKFAPTEPSTFSPVLGGLFIGGAQACSIVLSGKTLGVSTAYAQAGHAFWSLVSPSTMNAPSSYSSLSFALGIFVGAQIINAQAFMPIHSDVPSLPSPFAAVAGGTVMVFGARLAGGCTSGHGISGMATMSLASFYTVASMFAGGIGYSLLSAIVS